MKAKDRVAKKTARKIVSMPCWAYCVQISTTRRESASPACVASASRWMVALMNSTARWAPVVTAWMEAPENQ